MSRIHATAIVDVQAELDDSVQVGPYAVIGPRVRIGAGSRVAAHAVLQGPTVMGRGNQVYSFASIGGDPQDKKYAGEPTLLEIGDRNVFRECTTVNRGTVQGGGVTRVGDDNLFMAYVHVAHDCQVGNQTILANSTNLAGHVEVGDWAILGGYTGVHQFCKVGAHAMCGVGTVLLHDLPPFVMCSGNPSSPHGLNTEGLRRRGFEAATIDLLKRCYRILYRQGLSLEQAQAEIAGQRLALGEDAGSGQASRTLALLLEFLGRVSRGIVR